MAMRAVIGRELRAESRREMTYWLRVLTAGVVVATGFVTLRQQNLPPAEMGVKLFGCLNAVVFGAIWLLVPLLSADCLSREKREATLGLLFLTPLLPGEVVHAKFMVHGLRAAGLLAAVAPVMTVPFMFGGLGWRESIMALLLNTAASVMALSAGLIASALCKQWVRALVLAEILSLAAMVLFVRAHAAWHDTKWGANPSPTSRIRFFSQLHLATGWDGAWNGVFGKFVLPRGMIATGPRGSAIMQYAVIDGRWMLVPVATPPGRSPSAVQDDLLYGAQIMLAGALTFMLAVLIFAQRKTRQDWQEAGPGRWTVWLQITFCQTVYWQSFFHRSMKIKLRRNPISWLQQYSWSARSIKWGLCLVIILAESTLLATMSWWDIRDWQIILLMFALATAAFSAAGSFHDEKHTGALELLLVTPLKEWQIIWGRLSGILRQFLPSLLVIGVVWFFAGNFRSGVRHTYLADMQQYAAWAAAIVAVAVVGLYWAITRFNFFTAWLLTAAIGIGLPVAVVMISYKRPQYDPPGLDRWLEYSDNPSLLMLVVASVFALGLYAKLRKRKFLPGH